MNKQATNPAINPTAELTIDPTTGSTIGSAIEPATGSTIRPTARSLTPQEAGQVNGGFIPYFGIPYPHPHDTIVPITPERPGLIVSPRPTDLGGKILTPRPSGSSGSGGSSGFRIGSGVAASGSNRRRRGFRILN